MAFSEASAYLGMMKLKTTLFLLAFSFVLLALKSTSQDPKAIIQASENLFRGTKTFSEMEMQIVRKEWSKTITMKSWTHGYERTAMLVTGPAREKGTAFLRVDRSVWNWQPKIDRVIKMPPSMLSDGWMGSDFSNDDLVKESSFVNDYTHIHLKDTTIENQLCYQFELTPKEEAAVVWGKIQMNIAKKTKYQLLTKFYDEDLELVNTLRFSEMKNLGGKVLPSKMTMTPAENPSNKTIVRYISLDFNPDIPESFFTVQNLKRLR